MVESKKTLLRQRELELKYGDEQVFVIPYKDSINIPDYFSLWNNKIAKIFNSSLNNGKFILRADAEENISFQQIIPYILLKSTDDKYFATKRINGEERLRGKLSLGIGGHINLSDQDNDYRQMIMNCMWREMSEEVYAARKSNIISVNEFGTVRDLSSSTPDHIGIVFIATVKEPSKIKIKEKDTLKGMWMSLQEMLNDLFKFESWSKLIVAELVHPN